MNTKTKKTQTILIATLIAAIVVSFSGMMVAYANDNDEDTNHWPWDEEDVRSVFTGDYSQNEINDMMDDAVEDANQHAIEALAIARYSMQEIITEHRENEGIDGPPTILEMLNLLTKTEPDIPTHEPDPHGGIEYPTPRDLSLDERRQVSSDGGFGTYLDQNTSSITGVFSKNQVHDSGITLGDLSFLYAPTVLAPNYSPVEVTTMYADEGSETDTLKKVIIFDFTTDEFQWDNNFIVDSAFMATYTNSTFGKDYYKIMILQDGNDWNVSIHNYVTDKWELWDTISGSTERSVGWNVWEHTGFTNNCPATLPEIGALNVKVFDGQYWQAAHSNFATVYNSGTVCNIEGATFTTNYDNWTVDD